MGICETSAEYTSPNFGDHDPMEFAKGGGGDPDLYVWSYIMILGDGKKSRKKKKIKKNTFFGGGVTKNISTREFFAHPAAGPEINTFFILAPNITG